MKIKLDGLLLATFFLLPTTFFAQRGKDLDYTVTDSNTIVNTYTYLTANASAGSLSLTVNNNAMSGGAFAANLAAGDLIMIIQMQGASMDIDVTPTASWGGQYTVPGAYLWSGDWMQHQEEWGKITNYNNSGKFEQVEVRSVSGSNNITLQCGLVNSYTASGHVQIVRIPRFNNLTLNTNTSLVPPTWDGNTGGIVAVEVNGNLVFNTNSKFNASGKGFRGGIISGEVGIASTPLSTNGPGNGNSQLGSYVDDEGARKGESIGGYTTEYDALYSRYGRGAPANGGGGGGYQNCGGGGGSNIGTGTYTGKGVPLSVPATYNTAWNLEMAGFGGSSSPGGGRGGYSYSTSNQDAISVGPNLNAWSGDYRKVNGGLGGHSLTYDATRLFMGGGGGAGDQDQGQGGPGGNGGGIVFITCYGTISGSGSIESDGAVGQNSNPLNQTPVANTTQKRGNDGAGGAGAGGAVYIKNSNALPATISIFARGGQGGNHALLLSQFASAEGGGPGGGGGGGSIAFTSGTPSQVVTGGASGTSTSAHLSEFTPNGATGGASGISGLSTSIFNITAQNDTICAGQTTSLTAVATGTLPGTVYWYSSQFGAATVGSGLTYNTPALATTTTYYVGVCPGTFRVPVTVVVNPNPVISGPAVLTNPTCSNPGSITGLTVSNGTSPYTYSWSGTTTAGPNYTNIPAGTYTLTVTDSKGCQDTDGPHTLTGVAGPIINTSGLAIQHQSCNGTMGSITGITASGTSLSYSWSNGGGSSLNATNLAAGNYTLTVTDGNGCTATAGPYTINFIAGPSINAAGITIVPSTCGNANGSISGITASGTGLSYTWNGSASASTNLSNQLGGNYTLVVTDANGCTASSGPHNIPSFASPVINTGSIVIVNENCNQGDGSISGITVSGGAPGYTISWSGTTQTTLNLTNLSAGSYTLTVTDQNSCVVNSGPYTISNAGGPTLNTAGVAIQNQICNGTMGSITGITATGTSLTYVWTNGGGSALNATNLSAGNYSLTVTDGNGCSVSAGPYTVNFVAGPTINSAGISISPSTCGNTNGSISGITASGTGLSYTWNGTASATTNLSNQLGGNYTLVVTDVNGCTASSGPHTIPSQNSPVINITGIQISPETCSMQNGAISGITVSGGLAPLVNTWTGTAQTTLDISNLSAGSYSLTVTDQNGCVANAGPFNVSFVNGPTLNETNAATTDITCTGVGGTVTGITVTGTSLSYSWSNSGGSSLNASNLLPGAYTLTVTDGNGCTAISAPYLINLPVPPSIDISNMVVSASSCTSNTGSISGIVINGGTNPVYSWSSGQSTLNISSLAPGTYTLNVTDDNLCTDSEVVTVGTVNSPVIDTNNMILSDENCGQNNGSITGIIISGGTPNYSYEWNGNSALNTLDLSSVSAGINTLVVTDAQGCDVQVDIALSETNAPVISSVNLIVQQPSCIDLGSISGLQASGESALTYSWSNTETTLDINDLVAGTYTLTVTDNFGCSSIYGPVTITNPVQPVADFTWSPESPLVNNQVQFSNTSSYIGSITSVWVVEGSTTVSTDFSTIFTTEGEYPVQLIIVDQNGCQDSITQIVTIFGELIIPNVITANEDGVNDLFEIKGLQPNSSLVILNRWGEIVFETDNYENDWDGRDRSGKKLVDGVYTYTFVTADDNRKHGFVHLYN